MQEKSVVVRGAAYSLEAIYKTCYVFFDRAYIRLEGEPGKEVSVLLRPRPDVKPAQWNEIVGEFDNELIHQALRAKISASNQKIRELIVARALASAEGAVVSSKEGRPAAEMDEALEKEIEKLLAEVEGQAGGADPLGIIAPWGKQDHNQDQKKGREKESA